MVGRSKYHTVHANPRQHPQKAELLLRSRAFCVSTGKQQLCLSRRATTELWGPQRGRRFTARLDTTAKALWKLNWFLRDFGYDAELLSRDEIDDKNLVGLRGVVKVSHAVVNGTSLPNLDAFAPQARWPELGTETGNSVSRSGVAS